MATFLYKATLNLPFLVSPAQYIHLSLYALEGVFLYLAYQDVWPCHVFFHELYTNQQLLCLAFSHLHLMVIL